MALIRNDLALALASTTASSNSSLVGGISVPGILSMLTPSSARKLPIAKILQTAHRSVQSVVRPLSKGRHCDVSRTKGTAKIRITIKTRLLPVF